jgi:hypothetical protein
VLLNNFNQQNLDKIVRNKCQLVYLSGEYDKKEIVSGISIKCSQFFQIQISLVHKRGNFLWIPENNNTNIQKYFGDVPRALRRLLRYY